MVVGGKGGVWCRVVFRRMDEVTEIGRVASSAEVITLDDISER